LAPSDGDMGDRFGWAVSTDGERVLVGARSDENDGLIGSGSAYVFRHTDDGWLEEAKLTDPNRAANDAFGFSVSLAGTTALVGASGDDDPGLDSGAAHVFRHVGIGWVHEAELEAPDAEGQERFGRAVALAANIAVVGASHDGDDGTHSGSAYVYRRGPEGWTEDRKLTASDAAAGARFGRAVSIAPVGDLVVIGAPSAGAVGSGAAYLFADHGGKWSEVAKFAPYADVSGAQFGTSTAAASGRAVVGAPRGSEDPGTVDVILTEPGACPSIGDLNGDGRVSFADLLMLAGAWGACPPIPAPCAADLNGDGIVSGTDLLMLLSRWTR
ncbi:MAG: hypothetical protein GY715_20245, partial [Planctomycetes bacterium]|nr:hypothetical protein [Planctomycetota bacterium]